VADNGILFTDLLHLGAISLTTPEGLLNVLDQKPDLDDLTETSRIKPIDCARRFVAKRYHLMKELQEDNSKEDVFYDKEFDETPYSIVENYKSDKRKMNAELFLEFLAENLVQRHGCPPNQSRELAETLVFGKKKVKDGEYAILELHSRLPRDDDSDSGIKTLVGTDAVKREYYRRKNNHWIRDSTVSDENFIDNNTLFCNISNKCVKNMPIKTCDTEADASDRMREIAIKKMQNEFHSRFDESTRNIQEELTKKIEAASEQLIKLRRLATVEQIRFSLKQYEMGKYAVQDGDPIVSPYARVRDLIFAQADFAKRQNDIFAFVEAFCREPIPEREDTHWFYCKETNVKLMPMSLYELCCGFIDGKYVDALNEVCRKYGEIGDDGDAIVDKYSGYILRKIEYSEEEGYDEAGFKIVSHDIIEKDAATVLIEGLAHKKRVFEDERSELIYRILDFLSYKVGIATEDLEPSVFPLSTELIEKLVKPKEKYEAFAERAKKEGKLLPPYSNYYNQNIIFIVCSVLFVCIQTAIPSFKSNRVVPGCIKSFEGYPATGIENISGIQFLACLLLKSKSSSAPWNSIEQLTVTKLTRGIKDMIEKNIIVRDDIVKRYATKSEYIELFPEITIPKEHAIQKWTHFMPPVVPFQIRDRLHPPAAHLKSEMLEQMRHTNRQQHETIFVYKSKALLHGYGVIEAIHAIIAQKEVFLKTSAKLPFLENACCNEAGINPIRYFIAQEDESKTIQKYIGVVHSIENHLEEIRTLSSAAMLHHSLNTNLTFADLPQGKYDINIYAAFIYYCKLDTNAPIPEDLLSIMSAKPAQYRETWSLEEKIEFFRRNGKTYSGADLDALMKIVNHRNLVKIYQPTPFLQIPALKEFLEHLERVATREDGAPVVEIPLIEKLENVLDSYRPTEMYSEPTDKLSTLKTYLKKSNRDMLKEIIGFMEEFGKQSATELDRFQTHFEKCTEWKLESKDSFDHDDSLHASTTYIKNAVYNMIKGWPSILLNRIHFKNVPRHWGFSELHRQDIKHCLNSYYDVLQPFKDDKTILLLLKEIQSKTDLHTLLQMIPNFTPIHKDGNTYYSLMDKEAIFLLNQYLYFSVFYEYVREADNPDLLFKDINLKKQTQRLRNAENANSLNFVNSVVGEEEESGFAEEYGEYVLNEVEIEIGNQETLKTRICELLAVFIGIQIKEKSVIHFSYKDISAKMQKSRTQEKKAITDFFKHMERDERLMENMKKKLKLGRWDVGNQKGLVDYDATAYERERNEQLARAGYGELADDVFGLHDMGEAEVVRGIDDLEAEGRRLMEADDPEGFTLGMLPEEYADNYDETENDREDDW
jgi:hypothetical protein